MGGIFFTLRMGFINIVGFKHALKIVYSQHKSHHKKPTSSKKNISFYKNQKSKSQPKPPKTNHKTNNLKPYNS